MPARRSSGADASGTAAAAAVPALSRRHAAGAPSARGLLFTLLGEFVLTADGTAWTSAVLAAFDPIERIIAQGRDNGEVRPDLDAKLATYMVVGVAEMVLTGYVIGSLSRTDAESFARDEKQLLSLLLDGMSTRSG
jgi:hypothetical protein